MRLRELQGAVLGYARDFDAARLSARDAARVIERVSVMKNALGGIEAMAAARVAETKVWAESGDRSAAHHLARTTGVSVAQASETLRTAERLARAPATEEALRSGTLSLQQASAITDAVVVNPGAEAELLDRAERASLGELRDEAARTKAAHSDLEARRARIHARRGFRHYVDREGVWHGHLRDNPERGAQLVAALSGPRDRLFRAARKEGRREPLEAYAADALYEVVTGKAEATDSARPHGSARAKVIVRVDLDAALRGFPADGETCEIAGYGPVAVSAVRELLATGQPIMAAVLTKGKDVVSVTHLGRRPTARQQTALQWLYPECEVEGCHNSAFLEWDHTEPWSETRRTRLRDLAGKCSHCHWLKHAKGWEMVPGKGKRPMVPPDDPRHPRHRRGARSSKDPPGEAA
jgi:hypothetical protein